MQIPLTKGTKAGKHADFRDALPINAIFIPKPENPHISPIPGLTKHSDAVGRDRGGIYFESDQLKGHFRVSGGKLIEVSKGAKSNVLVTELGDISGDDQAVLNYTLTNLVITANRKQWLYNRTDGLRQVTDPDLGEPLDTTWINAKLYDLSYDKATKNTYIVQHEVNKDDAIETLKYNTSDISPDLPYGLEYITGNQVAVFNRHTIEFFYDRGGNGFTLQRQEARTIDGGIVGVNCKCRFMKSFAILGGAHDESINFFVMTGTGLAPIGTSEIQTVLEEYTEDELKVARLESRAERGHNFLIAHLLRHTLIYDGVTKQWARAVTGLELNVYRAINGVFDPVFNKWIYGDRTRGELAKIDYTVFSQYGLQQEMRLFTPWIVAPMRTISQMDLPTVYPLVDKENDSSLFISATQDGLTYSPERPYNVHNILDYRQRLVFRNVGRVKNSIGFQLRYVSSLPISFGAALGVQIA